MNASTLAIIRGGLCCPVGLRSATALAAMRAGVTRTVVPDDRPDATVCRLSVVPDEASRAERMDALLQHALREAFERPPGRWPPSIPLFMSLPSSVGGVAVDETRLLGAVRAEVSSLTGSELVFDTASAVREGRAGIFTALHQARVTLPRSPFPLALIVAVDSLADPTTLAALGDQRLLLEDPNLDGRIPGEAAAVFLVAPATTIPRTEVLALIAAIETDHDATGFAEFHQGQSLNRGHGLTRVMQRLASAFRGRADTVVTGQPSEGYWGRELSYAYLRNVPLMPEPFHHRTPGTEIGDAGAAAGGVALHRALGELRPTGRAAAPRRSALVYAVSDEGHIGGLALFPPQT